MRKVTQQISKAFINGESKKVGNTRTDGNSVWLHGHEIARKMGGYVQINNCGYETVTTKERLNGLLEEMGFNRSIYQKNFEWFWKDGKEFPCNQWVPVMAGLGNRKDV